MRINKEKKILADEFMKDLKKGFDRWRRKFLRSVEEVQKKVKLEEIAKRGLEKMPPIFKKLNFQPKEKSPKFKRIRKIFKGFFIIIFIITIITVGGLIVFSVGVYGYGWGKNCSNRIMEIFPYPIAIVNYRWLKFSDYCDDFRTLTNFYEKEGLFSGKEIQGTLKDTIQNDILEKMIGDEIAFGVARKYGLKVTLQEIEEEFQKIMEKSEDKEQIENNLKNLYNWDLAQFKEEVLKPLLLQRKLRKKIIEDENFALEAKNKAEEVLEMVRLGEKEFSELAEEYSKDRSASQGGDLGWFTQSTMIPEFEKVAFSLEPGEVSDLVESLDGYHIIKVEEIKNVGGVKKIRARHILIKKKDLDTYFKEEKARARIWRFIR